MAETLKFDIVGDASSGNRAMRGFADNSALAAKGAEVLSRAMDKQQRGAKLTAAEMSALSGVVRRFGDAEDKAALKTLAAAAAVDRLDRELKKNEKSRFSSLFGGSGGGGIGGLFGGGGGGGAGASGIGAILPGASGLVNPYTIGLGVAATPFLGTAAGGSILGALGTGITGLGIFGALSTGKAPAAVSLLQVKAAQDQLAASQDRLNKLQSSGKATAAQLAAAQASVATAQDKLNKLQDASKASAAWKAQNEGAIQARAAFSSLFSTAQNDLRNISTVFQGPLTAIANTAKTVLPYIFRPLGQSLKEIAGPLQQIGETLAISFASPRIQQSIAAVTKAFTQFLTGFTGQIPGIVNALATGIESIANSFTRHPDMIIGMEKVLAFLLKLPGYVASGLAALTNVTHWLVFGLPHDVSIGLDNTRKFFERFGHDVESIWNTMKRSVEDAALELAKVVLIGFRDLSNGVLNVIGGIIHGLAAAFGWLPFGVGSSLRNAAKSFDSWHNHFTSGINDQINHITAMQAAINGLHGKTVGITVRVAGSGGEYITSSTGAKGQVNVYPVRAAAAGWRVPGSGNSDSVPAMLTPGEAVVPKRLVPAVAPFLAANRVPGFAQGGLAGAVDTLGSYAGGYFSQLNASILASTLSTVNRNVAASLASAAFTSGPAAYGTAAAAQAFARALLPSYGWASQWPSLLALWNRESGWNPYAVNPSSGAYGIPQALGKGHPYSLGDYANQVRWGLSYIAGRYGSPNAAWGHETAFGWYDNGGMLKPGLTLALNTTGRAEQVLPARGGTGGGATVIHVTLQNHGAIGSPAELEAWLEKQFSALAYHGKAKRILKSVGGM